MHAASPTDTRVHAEAERSRRILWTVIVLGLVAAGFFFGFIAMHF